MSLPPPGTECRNMTAAAPTASTGTARARRSSECSRIWRTTIGTRIANRRHMIGDHHGRTAARATLLVAATDEILGTHRLPPVMMRNLASRAAADLACQQLKRGCEGERRPRRDHPADQARLGDGHIGGQAARHQQRPRKHPALAAGPRVRQQRDRRLHRPRARRPRTRGRRRRTPPGRGPVVPRRTGHRGTPRRHRPGRLPRPRQSP